MIKIVVLYKRGFETLTFTHGSNAMRRYGQLIQERNGNVCIAAYVYGPDDELKDVFERR